MAEALVEEPESTLENYFCHFCNIEFDDVSRDFTCPRCHGGFIEELLTGSSNTSEVESADVDMGDDPAYYDLNNRLTGELSSLLMSVAGARPASTADDHHSDQTNGRNSQRGRRRRYGMHNFNHFDNFLQDFLITMADNDGQAGPPMFFMGDPGDYAWGREGLDSIVTNLLNQMDGCGPPPLTKEQIALIPNVEITPKQVNSKLQCSVCLENFENKENVRQLSCQHVYHENCLFPWLTLHGTCPICRKLLTTEIKNEAERIQLNAAVVAAAAAATNLQSVAELFNTNPAGTTAAANPRNTTTGSSSSSQTSSNEMRNNLQQHNNQPSASSGSTGTIAETNRDRGNVGAAGQNNVASEIDENVDFDYD